MHIALFSPAWPPSQSANGIVTYVAVMREVLLDLGHRVSIFTSEGGGAKERETDVYRVKFRQSGPLRSAVERWLGLPISSVFRFGQSIAEAMLQVHRRDPIDVAEMEESFGWCRDVAAGVPFPVVVKLHGPAFRHIIPEERHTRFSRLKIRLEGEALKQQAVITSPSRCTLEDTCNRYALTPSVAMTVPNPIDAARLPCWSINNADKDTVLFVGRFDNVKGADRVMGMFSILHSRVPSSRLIICGPDSGFIDRDGRRLNFDAYVQRHVPPATASAIRFLGRVPPVEVLEMRRRARVTVFGSRMENLPYAVVEAMAQGCPLAAMQCDGVDELIVPRATGLLSGNVDAFADDVERLLLIDELAIQVSDGARKFALQHCQRESVAAQTIGAYEAAIKLRDRSALLPS
jgi:glycosyltransferase involved in cell wall biosynthesis